MTSKAVQVVKAVWFEIRPKPEEHVTSIFRIAEKAIKKPAEDGGELVESRAGKQGLRQASVILKGYTSADGDDELLRNVGFSPNYTALHTTQRIVSLRVYIFSVAPLFYVLQCSRAL
jgi:hypothetical protein